MRIAFLLSLALQSVVVSAVTCAVDAGVTADPSAQGCGQWFDGSATSQYELTNPTPARCSVYFFNELRVGCSCDWDLCNDDPEPTLYAPDRTPVPGLAVAVRAATLDFMNASAGQGVLYLWVEGLTPYVAWAATFRDATQVELDSLGASLDAAGIATVSSSLIDLPDVSTTGVDAVVQLQLVPGVATPGATTQGATFTGDKLSGSSLMSSATECQTACDDSEVCAGYTFWPHSKWCSLFASSGSSRPSAHATISAASSSNRCHSTVHLRYDLTDANNVFLRKADTVTEHECCDLCLGESACAGFHFKRKKAKCVLLSQAHGTTVSTPSFAVLGRIL